MVIMKVLILLSAFVLACQATSEADIFQQWKEFQIKFEKNYKSPVESRRRLNIFKENLDRIEVHNALYENGVKSYKLGVNQFADWTPEEFLQYVNKYKREPHPSGKVLLPVSSNLGAPTSVDWREQNAVREVKDQGDCGSCWSFSATGAIEGQLALKKNITVSLSEQNLIDCAGRGYRCYGCSGGSMRGAFQYVIDEGITSEEKYPYKGDAENCSSLEPSYRIVSYNTVTKTEDSLRNVVARMGPVSVGIEATKNLHLYKSGIFYDETCTGQLNHGVLAVGYGEEDGSAYWIVKNSWGASWGDQGYFKLARNRYNNCGIASDAYLPSVED